MVPLSTPLGMKPRYTSRILLVGSMSQKDSVGGDPVWEVLGLVSFLRWSLEPNALEPRKLQVER